MSHLIMRELNKGNSDIVDYVVAAGAKWQEVIGSSEFDDISSLAGWCSNNQMWFEQNCGGLLLGQEVMVYAGISGFYDPKAGFDDEGRHNALQVYNAIKRSNCSMEVKYHADRAARSYNLIDD